jgi:arylformamidase
MIDLTKYRVVDLTMELHPGIHRVNQEYVHGHEVRRLELRQFIYAPDRCYMFWVDTETHIGTHVEGPSHYDPEAASVGELPASLFMGEAVVLDFTPLQPRRGRPQPITPSDLKAVGPGDIVLMWSPYDEREAPYISADAARWLKDTEIKMVGLQHVGLEAPGLQPSDHFVSHASFLGNDIPVIENLVNLETLTRKRVVYIGLPLRIIGLDSSWVRAIALEDR